ncbi:hypothetical protein EDD17DRAFT_1572413 [Pisolithus thermaeus]|nr:hypothetical protein EDD17DRAFT_1572413 [Pisolithus thermaeus]
MSSGTARTYTFLVTLFLLLAVTSTVIVRSLILRRRHRRLLDQATNQRFAGDVGLSMVTRSTGTRRRQRVVGEKPALWQVWIRSSDGADRGSGRVVCSDIKPVSVAYVDKEDDKEPPFQFPEKPPPLRTQSIFGSFHKRPRSTQEPPTLPSNCESLSSRPSHTSRLRVSVLVAMPATGCSASFSSPQEDSSLEVSRLPPIEIGVVEVDVHG